MCPNTVKTLARDDADLVVSGDAWTRPAAIDAPTAPAETFSKSRRDSSDMF
jgi:hypothetical protein